MHRNSSETVRTKQRATEKARGAEVRFGHLQEFDRVTVEWGRGYSEDR